MITSHWFFWLFLSLFVLNEVWEFGLTFLNIRHTKKNKDKIPDFYLGKISQHNYEKSVAYTLEKADFSIKTGFFHILLMWLFILGNFFSNADLITKSWFPDNSLHHAVSYCVLIGLTLMIFDLPFKLYSQFVIEEKYGFNKMTFLVFASDVVKTLLLSAVLGLPLLYLVFYLFEKAGDSWWLWTFLAVTLFQLLIAAVFPTFLAPLFNKFTPLENKDLKEEIESVAKKINFKMSGIYTIDGSKRSSHSNAYFAGLGRFRRIVLFDTLMDQLNQKEIVAVLAHEMGHNVKKHIQKTMILSTIFSFLGFWILSLLINWQPFFDAFNAGEASIHKALVLISLFSGVFTFYLIPLINYMSRKYEYEADAFSIKTTGYNGEMASSLVKLSKENLSNLTPHPLYSFYHYSHPTTQERVDAIEKLK